MVTFLSNGHFLRLPMAVTKKQYTRACKVVDKILAEHTYDVIVRKRNEHKVTKNPELKKFAALHLKYYRNNKTITEYEKENENLPERHVCENCHREHKEEGNEFYHLSFIEQDEANILGHKKFKDPTAFSDLSRESFKLCLECNKYLTQKADEIENEASVTWCSYVYSLVLQFPLQRHSFFSFLSILLSD